MWNGNAAYQNAFQYHLVPGYSADPQHSYYGQPSTLVQVTFKPDIPEEHRADLEARVRAHHARLDVNDPRKLAIRAHVYKGWHTEGSTDQRLHATFTYHNSLGTAAGKNTIDRPIHLHYY